MHITQMGIAGTFCSQMQSAGYACRTHSIIPRFGSVAESILLLLLAGKLHAVWAFWQQNVQFLWLAELTIPQNPDGKVRMDLITQHGIQPPDVSICKDSDGTDWLLGVGGYGKVKLQPEPLKL